MTKNATRREMGIGGWGGGRKKNIGRETHTEKERSERKEK